MKTLWKLDEIGWKIMEMVENTMKRNMAENVTKMDGSSLKMDENMKILGNLDPGPLY